MTASSHCLARPGMGGALGWALGFLVLQAAIRLLVSPTLQADEAEVVLSTQLLSAGYGDHPPLYAWLYTALSALLGINVFSLALLKYGLLSFGVWQVYRLVRGLADEALAGLAVLSYLFFWQVMPSMQVDYTHSVLLLAVTAWYLRQYLGFLQDPSPRALLLLAGIAGLGLLTKPNFAFVLLGSLLAGLTDAGYRRVLLPARAPLVLLLAGLVASPYFLWLSRQGTRAVDPRVVSDVQGFSALAGLVSLGTFAAMVAVNFVPFALVALLVIRRSHPGASLREALRAGASPGPEARLLWRTLLAGLLLFGLTLFLLNSTDIRERYVIPFDVVLPIAFALHFRNGIGGAGLRFFCRAAAVLALFLIAFNANEVIKPYTSGKADTLNLPFRDLRAQILAAGFSDGDNVLVGAHLYGGNLKRLFPRSRVVALSKRLVSLDPARPTMLAWVADRLGKERWEAPGLPPDLQRALERYGGAPVIRPEAVRYVEAPYLYYPEKTFRMGLAMLPAGTLLPLTRE